MAFIESVNQIIRDRRTVKPKFMADKAVDRMVVEEMLENANWAPTHGLTEHGDSVFLQAPLERVWRRFSQPPTRL